MSKSIPLHGVRILKQIATDFRSKVSLPSSNAWKKLDDDEIWKHFVYQVAVVGGSSAYKRISGSAHAQSKLNFEHLRSKTPDMRKHIINDILCSEGVRYASADVAKCLKTKAIVHNFGVLSDFPGGPSAYLVYIASLPDESARLSKVQRDMSYIKLKGARDLLAELGMVTQIIALDTRVLNILRLLGTKIPNDIQTNSLKYMELQSELITRVCTPIGITGVHLDRILYQHYDAICDRLNDRNT